MPLIAIAVASYAAGLMAGFSAAGWIAAASAAAVSVGAMLVGRHRTLAACALVVSLGATVARETADADVLNPPVRTRWAASHVAASPDASALARWRARASMSIDSLFREDAPVVKALLIADTRDLPLDLRDRYARAGLVHLLSISGLHVAIISGAMLLLLQALRIPRRFARWLAVAGTALYVAAIGAPAPALRCAAMLAAGTASWALQRPVSPWATLALGAFVPIAIDPRVVLDLGYQLSVSGFAALTAASLWSRRMLPHDIGPIRRKIATDLAVSTAATIVTAPLVAWHFARLSLIAPLTNLVAAPVVGVMQPALFLALVLAPLATPFGVPAAVVADGARVLVRALDAIALAGSAVPGASIVVAPSLAVAVLGGAAALAVVGAASSPRHRFSWLALGIAAVAAMAWWPVVPRGARGLELHIIDVGQGDAVALRTPAGRWIVVDAGGGRGSGDAGRRIVVPYLRRLGGDVAMFVMSHPHDDHVGGAAQLITILNPLEVRDGAFAGTSPSYRAALVAARERGVPWRRVHPRDSVTVDGAVVTFLAPDSAWTASLTDPNLASVVLTVRFGRVRFLLTGDAEAAEEEWLLAHDAHALRADVLKVAHHGSATSSIGPFLDAVRPTLALISVGARNRYGHPSPGVVDSLVARGVTVRRTDRAGTIVVSTDAEGTAFRTSLFPSRARP